MALAILAASPAREVQAKPSPSGALIAEGLKAFRAQREEEALQIFTRAWEASKSPCARMYMGFAENALSLWVEADRHLREVLPQRQLQCVAKNLALIEEQLPLVGRHLGTLEVRGTEGAEVKLNGKVIGNLPMPEPVTVVVGSGVLDVAAPGRVAIRRPVEITTGRLTREVVELPAVASQPAVGPTSDPAPPPPSPLRTLGWVSAGGALAGLGVGAIALILREGHAADYNREPSCGSMMEAATCKEHRDGVSSSESLAIGGFVSAGILGATSAVLFIVAPSARDTSRTAFACGAGPGAFGISCAGRF